MTCLMQKERERVAVRAGGFEAGVDSLDALAGEPVRELLEACDSVGKEFMTELATSVDETDVELEFRDVNAEHWFSHDGDLLVWNQMAARVKLADTSSALRERLWILSDLGALALGGCRELL
jgi:hypothetical protein